jgi:pheromone shutdown protein TraB
VQYYSNEHLNKVKLVHIFADGIRIVVVSTYLLKHLQVHSIVMQKLLNNYSQCCTFLFKHHWCKMRRVLVSASINLWIKAVFVFVAFGWLAGYKVWCKTPAGNWYSSWLCVMPHHPSVCQDSSRATHCSQSLLRDFSGKC